MNKRRARRRAEKGRSCLFCKKTDKRIPFQRIVEFACAWCCCRCARRKLINPCIYCGGPFYKIRSADRISGCVLSYHVLIGEKCSDYAQKGKPIVDENLLERDKKHRYKYRGGS